MSAAWSTASTIHHITVGFRNPNNIEVIPRPKEGGPSFSAPAELEDFQGIVEGE